MTTPTKINSAGITDREVTRYNVTNANDNSVQLEQLNRILKALDSRLTIAEEDISSIGSSSDEGTAAEFTVNVSQLLYSGGNLSIQAGGITATEIDFTTFDTDNITEGATNLYFTDERAQDAVGNILTDSSTIDFTYADGTPSITAIVKTDSINDTHIDWGLGANQVNADDVPVQYAGGASYTTVQQFLNVMTSPGLVTGGEFSDLGSGNLGITASVVLFRTADDDVSTLVFHNVSSGSLAITADGITRYIAVEYNSGTPQFIQNTTNHYNKDTEIPLGSVVNLGGVLFWTSNPYKTGDPITNIIQRFDGIAPIQRDAYEGGLLLGETGTRNVTLTAGTVWARLNDHAITAKDSSAADMRSVYYNGSSLVFASGLSQWDNLQYLNTGTWTLTTLTNNKYACLWFFVGAEDTYGFAYGTDQYNTLGDAALEGVPSYLSQNFFRQALLVGRIIFQKSAATATTIESAFETNLFTATAVNDHNNLSNLQGGTTSEYYHFTNAEHSVLGLIGNLTPAANKFPYFTGGASAALGDVTADALLLLADADVPRLSTANTWLAEQLVSVNSSNNAFEIRQIGTGNAFYVEDSANPDATPFLINDAGQVVAGHTVAVTAGLNAAGRICTYTNAANSGGGFQINRYRTTASLGADIELVKSATNTIGTNTAVASGAVIGTVWFNGADGTGFPIAASIAGEVDAAVSTGIVPGRIVISAADSTGALVERAQFDSTGVVFNQQGADSDFRVEGDTLPYMVFCDASAATENVCLLHGAAPTTTMDRGVIIGQVTTAPGTPTANAVSLWVADTTAGQSNLYAQNENGKKEQLTGLRDRVAGADFTVANTTLTNVTGLSINVEATTAYAFKAVLFTTSNVASGVKAAIAGTATATSIVYESLVLQTGTTVATTASRSTALAGTVANVTAVTVATIIIEGTILVNAAGTLTVQLATNAGTNTTTALIGSYFEVLPIGD